MINQQPLCVDDYGDAVFFGCYSGDLVWPDEAIIVGAILPQVKASYVDNRKGVAIRKESVRLFNENEANCNTCSFLRRVPHKKTLSGLLEGECAHPSPAFDVHPYRDRFRAYGHMIFAPSDYMGMPCWMARI